MILTYLILQQQLSNFIGFKLDHRQVYTAYINFQLNSILPCPVSAATVQKTPHFNFNSPDLHRLLLTYPLPQERVYPAVA
jgi:hypothetical protein